MNPVLLILAGASSALAGKRLLDEIDVDEEVARMEAFFERTGRRFDDSFSRFEEFLDELGSGGAVPAGTRTSLTRYHVHKAKGAVVITIEVPGLTHENIELSLDNARLKVSAKGEPVKGHAFAFTKTFSVDKKVDLSDIRATVKDGLLTITIKRDEVPDKAKGSIPVSAG